MEEISIRHAYSARMDPKLDPVLHEMQACIDDNYKLITKALQEGKAPSDLDKEHPAQSFKSVWHLLTTVDMGGTMTSSWSITLKSWCQNLSGPDSSSCTM